MWFGYDIHINSEAECYDKTSVWQLLILTLLGDLKWLPNLIKTQVTLSVSH